jgi:hypothetical protein
MFSKCNNLSPIEQLPASLVQLLTFYYRMRLLHSGKYPSGKFVPHRTKHVQEHGSGLPLRPLRQRTAA